MFLYNKVNSTQGKGKMLKSRVNTMFCGFSAFMHQWKKIVLDAFAVLT